MTTSIRRHGKADDIDPTEYRHLGDFYCGPNSLWYITYFDTHEALQARLPHGVTLASVLAQGGKCRHCGAAYAHGSVYLHNGQEIVLVGQICSANTFGQASREALAKDRLARAYETARERKQTAEAAEAWIAENPDVHAHLVAFADEVPFYSDLLYKLNRYGNLTDRQADAVRRGIDRDRERAARAVTREAEKAQKIADGVTVPTGVTNISGVVISTRWQDNAYGGRQVMTVEDDRGFRVWGSVPRSIDPQAGDRVAFLAEVSPSDTDPLFGFYKRPRKAGLL